ncbi:farnesyl pyrophosphate synthase-like [Lutzomyia longipalpis]|uniref:farnesyl pyrophosphate synthase-like n=1 Tax=Lutzomyia longipalpis TaxID=7200 RepID=UPI002483FEE9|nr:farnesyl pyrophosphate synthase-like [Lutzomyia longipalpis]
MSSNIHKKPSAILLANIEQSLLSNMESTKNDFAADLEKKQLQFLAMFPDLINELKAAYKVHDPDDGGEHLEEVLKYNVDGGKNIRSIILLKSYEEIASENMKTEENLKRASYLAWCLELMQTSFLILDDIIDGSRTRRGKLCWYMKEDNNFSVFSDGLMIHNCVYQLVKDHFSHLDCYVPLWELLLDCSFYTGLGQQMDMRTKFQDISRFTKDHYRRIVIKKTSFYTFYLPVAAAMVLVGYKKEEDFEQVKEILFEFGYFFQAQDDYLDCYGDPKLTGKIGTDIQEGKCTWLVATCLERADEAQKAILKENYAKEDEESVEKIKKLYEDLSIREAFHEYEEKAYKSLKENIPKTKNLPIKLCLNILEKIYKRKK